MLGSDDGDNNNIRICMDNKVTQSGLVCLLDDAGKVTPR